MNIAETVIEFNNCIYKLSNNSVIDYITSKGLKIDDSIKHNPYFQYKLFNIFPLISNDTITGVTIDNAVLYIKGYKHVYNISTNSSGGLTLEIDIDTNDGDKLFVKDKEIFEIIPNNKEIILIEHKQVLVGDINMDLVDSEESLSMSYIDKDGFIIKNKQLKLKQSSNGFILNETIDIHPLLLKEYYLMIDILASNHDCFYLERKRSNDDLLKIYEYEKMRDVTKKKIKYFVNSDLLSAMELDNFYSDQSISDYDILMLLKKYIMPDNIVSCILNKIANKCGIAFNINSINIHNKYSAEMLMLDDIIDNNNKKYTV